MDESADGDPTEEHPPSNEHEYHIPFKDMSWPTSGMSLKHIVASFGLVLLVGLVNFTEICCH